jgi:uncharacterized membrane protein YeaQ/YmgE (transglycosylase-associated protein family)
MAFTVIVMLVLGGLVAGLLAGYFIKGGGYGLRWDVILGLGGGIVGGWIFQALGVSPGAGLVAVAVVAFVVAAILIAVQRKIWPARA